MHSLLTPFTEGRPCVAALMEGCFHNSCGNFASSPSHLVTAQHFTGQRAGALPVVEGDLSVHRVNSNSIGKQTSTGHTGAPL